MTNRYSNRYQSTSPPLTTTAYRPRCSGDLREHAGASFRLREVEMQRKEVIEVIRHNMAAHADSIVFARWRRCASLCIVHGSAPLKLRPYGAIQICFFIIIIF